VSDFRRPAPVDWSALAARLAAASDATRRGAGPTGAQARRILAERGRALAAPPRAARPEGTLAVVGLALGLERYALEAALVREVIRPARLARLPGAPAFLVGIANLRGEIVDVIDVRGFLGLPPPPGPPARLVVLGGERPELALVADDVLELSAVDPARLAPVPDAPARSRPEYVRGLTPDGAVLLDGAAILRDPRLVIDGAGAATEVT
jgi:purine-binding chemotaxis protein CheW